MLILPGREEKCRKIMKYFQFIDNLVIMGGRNIITIVCHLFAGYEFHLNGWYEHFLVI